MKEEDIVSFVMLCKEGKCKRTIKSEPIQLNDLNRPTLTLRAKSFDVIVLRKEVDAMVLFYGEIIIAKTISCFFILMILDL
jgi:hypothetical protein